MKTARMLLVLLVVPMFLTGCLYPQDKKLQNQAPYQDQLQAVQRAVEEFQKDKGGILPIVTKDAETPIYQKYVIDFKRIAPRYMAEPPANSFEAGGVFQYVLVHAEDDPAVKLLDVRMAQKIQDAALRVRAYREEHNYPPYKEVLAKGVYTIDYEKMGLDEPLVVTSPYSQKDLHLIMNQDGQLFVDYTPDLIEALGKGTEGYGEGDDIRELLVEQTDFVPAFSLPYTIENGTNKPIFLTK